MKRSRLFAALAGILTVLVLQATVIGPALAPYPIALPAVLVASVAFVDGAATGMSLGFATGKDLRRIALINVKIAVVAPIPSARVRIAVIVNPGVFRNCRTA